MLLKEVIIIKNKIKYIILLFVVFVTFFINVQPVHAEESEYYQKEAFNSFQRYVISTAYQYLIDNNFISAESDVAVVYNMGSSYLYFYPDAYYTTSGTSGIHSKSNYYYAYPYKFSNDSDYENGNVSITTGNRSSDGLIFSTSQYLSHANHVVYDTTFDWSYSSTGGNAFVEGTLKNMTPEEAYLTFFGSSGSSDSGGSTDVNMTIVDTTALEQKINNIFILILFAISYAWFINPMFKQIKDIMKGE